MELFTHMANHAHGLVGIEAALLGIEYHKNAQDFVAIMIDVFLNGNTVDHGVGKLLPNDTFNRFLD
ncbi:MAG: hypothetical protein D6807_08690 [Alphaproteobacteria bacterium]|nr:MAG: hypothetical protein D6807_08690 [Alphaproteobacteria bacterium]